MFKQVTEEEFEVLSKYHPYEVRYYVDLAKATGRVKRIKTNGANGHVEKHEKQFTNTLTSTRESREWKGKRLKDSLIALGRSFGNTRQSAAAGTITEKVERAVDEVYHKNAFTQYRRSTLLEKIRKSTNLKDNQISPVISRMLTAKWLRVVPEDAKSALDVPIASERERPST